MEDIQPTRSRGLSRSISRSSSRQGNGTPIHVLLSNHFPDDHCVHHLEDGEGLHVDEDASSLHKTETQRRGHTASSSDVDDYFDVTSEIDTPKGKDTAVPEHGTTYQGIRGGSSFEQDIEASPELEKRTSAKSVKDPNLVSVLSTLAQ